MAAVCNLVYCNNILCIQIGVELSPPMNIVAHPVPHYGQLQVLWNPPNVQPPLRIHGYSVRFSGSTNFPTHPNGSEQYVSGNSTSITIAGLDPGRVYHVQVAAISQMGLTDYSEQVSATTYDGQ